MKLFTEQEAPLLRALGKLNYTNPFTPERLELEEIILGRPPAPERRVWNMHDGARGTREDVTELAELAKHWANGTARRETRRNLARRGGTGRHLPFVRKTSRRNDRADAQLPGRNPFPMLR